MVITVGLVLIACIVLITASVTGGDKTPAVIVNGSSPTPTPIVNGSIVNGSSSIFNGSQTTATPVPTVTPTPVPTPVFPDPIIDEEYWIWKNSTKNNTLPNNPWYVPGHPETQPGYIIYTPTPVPTPTPTPTPDPWDSYKHLPLRTWEYLPPNDYTAVNANESLFWNMYRSKGLEDFYHNDPGYCDNPMFHLEFLSRYLDEVKEPYVSITFEKLSIDPVTYNTSWYNVFDIPLAWYENTTIPKPTWNYDHTAFYYSTVVIEKSIPGGALMYLTDGTYRLHIEVFDHARTVRLGEVTKQICIL
jgi:hypothetical protein